MIKTLSKPTTPIEAYNLIKENAKRMPAPRDCSTLKIGEVARQGDCYLVRVKSIDKGQEVKNRQLAPGHSNGSRHIVAESPKVRLFKCRDADAAISKMLGFNILPVQIGPAIEALTPWTLTHPAHPFCAQFPAGEYLTIYQLDWATKQRALD